MPNHLDLRIEPRRLAEGAWVIRVEGEIDLCTGPTLERALEERVQAGATRLIVELDGAGYLDSHGLGLLVQVARRLEGRGGRLDLVSAAPRILKILKLTRCVQAFSIFPTLEAALAPPLAALEER